MQVGTVPTAQDVTFKVVSCAIWNPGCLSLSSVGFAAEPYEVSIDQGLALQMTQHSVA